MLDIKSVKVKCEICGEYRKGELNKETNKVISYCDKCNNDLSCELIIDKE
jgi:hypothetical protein